VGGSSTRASGGTLGLLAWVIFRFEIRTSAKRSGSRYKSNYGGLRLILYIALSVSDTT
jgi:hypothetical protein